MNKVTTIFVDTQNMEERYCEELYMEYLENQNKQLKEEIQDLKADYGNKAQVERDLLKEKINKAIELLQNSQMLFARTGGKTLFMKVIEEEIAILKGDNNE